MALAKQIVLASLLSIGILGQEAQPPPRAWIVALSAHVNDGLAQKLLYTDLFTFNRPLEIAIGLNPSFTFDPQSHTVFFVSEKGDDRRTLLEIIATSREPGYAQSVVVPRQSIPLPACDRCRRRQLAISADKRYFFALVDRLHSARMTIPAGVIATDDDASYYEQVVTTYDLGSRELLPDQGVFSLSSHGIHVVLPSRSPRSFNLLVVDDISNDLILNEYQLKQSGAIQSTREVSRVPLPPSADPFTRFVAIPSAASGLLIRSDGIVVAVTDSLRRTGVVSPPGEGRRFYDPTISEDGKLLFLPSGPKWDPKRNPPMYIDQLDVYSVGGLKPLKRLFLQRPLKMLAANADGTSLFGLTVNGLSMIVMNAETLWQETEYALSNPLDWTTFSNGFDHFAYCPE